MSYLMDCLMHHKAATFPRRSVLLPLPAQRDPSRMLESRMLESMQLESMKQ